MGLPEICAGCRKFCQRAGEVRIQRAAVRCAFNAQKCWQIGAEIRAAGGVEVVLSLISLMPARLPIASLNVGLTYNRMVV